MSTYLRIFFILTVILILSGCTAKKSDNNNSVMYDGYELVWSDEFDYKGLPDPEKWLFDTEGNEAGWGNHEAQFYTEAREENARVEDGTLFITARKEEFSEKDFTSARLISSEDWQYAMIEVRAKLPDAVGTWPAIWMMPGGWSFDDANWPAVGEIDIMEHVGYDPGVVHSSAHSADYYWKLGTQKTGIITVPDATTRFNNYRLEWTAEFMKTYVNDSLFFEYENEGLGESKWPYNKPFYLILNIAVGGDWGGQQGIDSTSFPQAIEIDFVRVYQKK